eukprot:5880161-Prorocentrum_lima.AAC.1
MTASAFSGIPCFPLGGHAEGRPLQGSHLGLRRCGLQVGGPSALPRGRIPDSPSGRRVAVWRGSF